MLKFCLVLIAALLVLFFSISRGPGGSGDSPVASADVVELPDSFSRHFPDVEQVLQSGPTRYQVTFADFLSQRPLVELSSLMGWFVLSDSWPPDQVIALSDDGSSINEIPCESTSNGCWYSQRDGRYARPIVGFNNDLVGTVESGANYVALALDVNQDRLIDIMYLQIQGALARYISSPIGQRFLDELWQRGEVGLCGAAEEVQDAGLSAQSPSIPLRPGLDERAVLQLCPPESSSDTDSSRIGGHRGSEEFAPENVRISHACRDALEGTGSGSSAPEIGRADPVAEGFKEIVKSLLGGLAEQSGKAAQAAWKARGGILAVWNILLEPSPTCCSLEEEVRRQREGAELRKKREQQDRDRYHGPPNTDPLDAGVPPEQEEDEDPSDGGVPPGGVVDVGPEPSPVDDPMAEICLRQLERLARLGFMNPASPQFECPNPAESPPATEADGVVGPIAVFCSAAQRERQQGYENLEAIFGAIEKDGCQTAGGPEERQFCEPWGQWRKGHEAGIGWVSLASLIGIGPDCRADGCGEW